jgi:hypothetical protein
MATDESYRDNKEEREIEEGFGEGFDQEDPEFLIEFDDISDHSSEQVPAGVPEEDEIFGIFDEDEETDEDGSFTLDSEEDAEEFAFLLEEEDEDEFLGPMDLAEGPSASTRTDEELEFIWEDDGSEKDEGDQDSSSNVFGGEDLEDEDLTGIEEYLGETPSELEETFDSLEEDEFSFEIEDEPGEVSFSSSFIASDEDSLEGESVQELEEEIFGLVDQNTPEEEDLEQVASAGPASTLSQEEDFLFDSELGEEQGLSPEEVGGLFSEEGEHNPDLDSFSQEDLGQEAIEEEIFEEEDAQEEVVQESRFGIPSAQDAARWGDPSIFGQSQENTEEGPGEEEFSAEESFDEAHNFMQESGSFQIPSGEFEIVDDPRDLQSGAYQVDPESGFEEVPEEAEFDPIYGKQEEGEIEEEFCTDEEPDYSDMEAIAPEDEHFFGDEPEVIGGYQGSPARRKMLALGMAASILVLLSVGVLIWNPDVKAVKDFRKMLGMNKASKGGRVVEVTKVDRPRIPLILPSGEVISEGPLRIAKGPDIQKVNGNPPRLSGKKPRTNLGETPKRGTKVPLRVTPKVSKGLMDMGRLFALVGKGLSKGTQRSIDYARSQGTLPTQPKMGLPTNPLIAKGPEIKKPIASPDLGGKGIEPKEGPKTTTSKTAPSGKSSSPTPIEVKPSKLAEATPKAAYFDTKALRRGIQALAQLRNGNFFVGRIYKVKPLEIILSLQNGEVAFVPDDLKKIVPLVDSEAKLLRGKEIGIVRLRNRNKLIGKILAESPDFIAIETDEKSKIFLPRTSILEVDRKKPTPITFGEEEDWSPEAFPIPEPEKEEGALPALPVVEKEEGDGPAIQVQIGEPEKTETPAKPGK